MSKEPNPDEYEDEDEYEKDVDAFDNYCDRKCDEYRDEKDEV